MSRYYQNAADAVRTCRKGKSFKGHFADKIEAGRKEYAIAAETIKYMTIIESLISISGVDASTCGIEDEDLFFVLVYELFFSADGKINGGGAVKRQLLAYEAKLRSALVLICKERNVAITDLKSLLPESLTSSLPRYIRLNYLKTGQSRDSLLKSSVSDYCPSSTADGLIPSLIRLPADVKSLPSQEFVSTATVIIQDKASCIPSQIMSDEWIHNASNGNNGNAIIGDIIDACSAPGNKTSHVASEIAHYLQSLQSKSSKPATGKSVSYIPKIMAMEKNPKRFELLCNRMMAAGAMLPQGLGALSTSRAGTYNNIISAHNVDFLSLDVTDPIYANVRYVLLDPSCSGSGCNSRTIERNLSTREQNESTCSRVQQLQAFQIAATKKAMEFPNVHTIVYSTCSVHREENEIVVGQVLHWCRHAAQREKLIDNEPMFGHAYASWELQSPSRFTLSAWKRRGIPVDPVVPPPQGIYLTQEEQLKVIRCLPDDDMNGFFVALYVNPVKKLKACSTTQLARRALLPKPANLHSDSADDYKKSKKNKDRHEHSDGNEEFGKKFKKSKYTEQSSNNVLPPAVVPVPAVKPVKVPKPVGFLKLWKPKGGKRK